MFWLRLVELCVSVSVVLFVTVWIRVGVVVGVWVEWGVLGRQVG